ncbi:B3 domain-containing transcription factor VRN1-like [Pyrus x bretschneideri]|uniref:B3 domain-containing transcription factor VRN1-like n=1 Tax=Pyrus x bretschneideri TaxID=225117 RepID=UPI00202F2BD3|nr:B3 domain-containing transcription factor VRN1-like [Pyrus x bretschneideri]
MASLLPEMDPRQRLSFSPTTPHFFKIIPVETSRYRKLRIPKKFVNNYGENLSNPVHFKLPSGAEWEIEVTRRGGEVWFDKGWPKFSEFYSLGYGDCLIFRYEWNSKFHVCIFDRSATEIEYPLPLPGMEETDEDDDESVEILEDFPPCPKTRQKSPLSSPPPRKRKRISTSIGSTSKKLETKSTLWMKPLTENEKAIALQRAIDFKSENAHFKVAMQPSYIFSQLVLPSEFAKKYLTQHPTGSAILRVPDGRTWNVKFKYDNKRARFLLGWPAFVEDNNLKIGDVCVFMLIKGFKITFEVAFYRRKEAAICSISSAAKECSGGLRTAQRGQEPFTISERSRAYKSYTSLDYEGEDEDSVGISDFQRCTKKTREKSPLSSPQPLKKIRTSNKAAKKRNINFRPTKIEPRSKSAVNSKHILENLVTY